MLRVRFVAVALLARPLGTASFVATSPRRLTPTPASAATSVHRRPRPPRRATASTALKNTIPPSSPPDRDELHLVTFDLDDTLFPIGPVVSDANAAQLRALIERGYDRADPGEIVAASKAIRKEVREAGVDITYTELRKRSIRREMERLGGGAAEGGPARDATVDAVFDAWLTERHASADRHLFPHACDALERIRKEHPAAVCGAITNGRGDPLEMPSLRSLFDFCVSGEDDGVFPRRKPDRGIYEAAVRRYEELRGGKMNGQADDDAVGFNWVHVGDDLANDVGASAACGARPVWFAAEEEEEDREEERVPSWSTATGEELARRAALDEAARKHVRARIASLEELPAAILEVLRN